MNEIHFTPCFCTCGRAEGIEVVGGSWSFVLSFWVLKGDEECKGKSKLYIIPDSRLIIPKTE
jgi:hypothetical protein